MKHPWIVIAICLALLAGATASSAQAEDWSLKKINPFGKNETGKSARSKQRSSWLPSIAAPRVPQTLTPTGIKQNLAKIGQSTRSAISSTTEALSPKNLVPQIQLPRLTLRSASDDDTAEVTDSKPSSPISLVQWLSPVKDSEDDRDRRDAQPANSWFGQDPPRP